MLLKKDKDTENLVFRHTSKTIEVGILPVIYGFRIRAGFKNSPCVELDWCAGDNQATIELYYQLLIEILNAREEKEAFKDLPPTSKIKPITLDKEFLEHILKQKRKEIQKIEFPKFIVGTTKLLCPNKYEELGM